MSEQKIQKKISDKLTKDGFFVIKLIKTNKNGIPDLICVRDDKTIFVEVKTEIGVLSEIQKYRLKELTNRGIDCFYSKGVELIKYNVGNI